MAAFYIYSGRVGTLPLLSSTGIEFPLNGSGRVGVSRVRGGGGGGRTFGFGF